MPQKTELLRTGTDVSNETAKAQITFRNGRHSLKDKNDKSGLSEKGKNEAMETGKEISKDIRDKKFDLVIFAGISSSVRTKSTQEYNIQGLKEDLSENSARSFEINLSSLFAEGYDKSFANMKSQLKQARNQIDQALKNGLIPIIKAPFPFFGDEQLINFGGGMDNLGLNGYMDDLTAPITEGDKGGEHVQTYNYLKNKGLDKTGRAALPDPRIIAFQQKYIESRMKKLLELLLPSYSKALVVNTSHGVLTDVAQVTALNPENPNDFGKTTETIINENEGVIVAPNGEITYREAQGKPKSQSEILMASIPNFIQEDLRQVLNSHQDEYLKAKALVDYFIQMQKVNSNLATKIFKLAKFKLKSWHSGLDLDQFELESFADVRTKSQEQNPNNKSETLWWLEQEFGKVVMSIVK
jgi:hypothetical protein